MHGGHDVLIMGGGLAGLSLSIQLARSNPNLDVVVAERAAHPPPTAAFKVGESTVEGAGHYFRNVLGLRSYLESEQIIKPGLRFYFTNRDNSDITNRVELGEALEPVTFQSYQLDRGKFEAKLAQYARDHGVTFLDNCKVKNLSLGNPQHTIELEQGDTEWTVESRWVIDATGRISILKRKENLSKEVPHGGISAAWFRLQAKLDIGTWDDDESWQRRVSQPDLRWRSTNHLMGDGYWVWLIPLGPEYTSVGIVADERHQPFDTFNTFEKALSWLEKNEPQCYAAVVAQRENLADFRRMKNFPLGCKQMYSADRWAVTGFAGVFHDPFYSPGSDVIAFNNSYITALVEADFAGREITSLAERYNEFFLRDFADPLFSVYADKYPLMANGQVFTVKVAWDYAWYWAVACPMFFQGKWTDVDFVDSVRDSITRANALAKTLQAMFIEWNKLYAASEVSGCYIDIGELSKLTRLHDELGAGFDDETLRANFARNVELLEQVATEMFWRAVRVLPDPPERRSINPYVISLDPRRWESDGLFVERLESEPDADLQKELDSLWFDPAY